MVWHLVASMDCYWVGLMDDLRVECSVLKLAAWMVPCWAVNSAVNLALSSAEWKDVNWVAWSANNLVV